MPYLAKILAGDPPAVAGLVDRLVLDAETYLDGGVMAGNLRPTADPRSRAAALTIWSLGTLVLHDHIERLLGVDLLSPDPESDPHIATYAAGTHAILNQGIATETFASEVEAGLNTLSESTSGTTIHTNDTEVAK